MQRFVGAFLMTFIMVIVVVFVYNRFVAKDGKSIADVGKPLPATT